ncbi:putative beta-lysine N-acetyltransferase [Bacillus testis]|uniref:putative beta-lysine N-acetyltransferase n=1 Tax=Bacillus testis TaxID=1622072 RepID=UPI00067ED539|nr:putative beta-lysine N-acetyltransferase [Bacillus testis]
MKDLAYTEEKHTKDYSVSYTVDPFNERIRVDDYYGCIGQILDLCHEKMLHHGFSKLIFKARREQCADLLARGYVLEAMVKGFFGGSDAYFFSCYYSSDRRNSAGWAEEDELMLRVRLHKGEKKDPKESYPLVLCTEEHAEALASLYQSVFNVYPVPMDDPAYIVSCMEKGSVFLAFQDSDSLISAVCGEIDKERRNAEITDCATKPEYRQFGLMQKLIRLMETELRQRAIHCLYSIARAKSFGMNAAFDRLGYAYTGRLANNCYIFDDMEDMNMWCKQL